MSSRAREPFGESQALRGATNPILWSVICLLLSSLVSLTGSGILDDPFHHGEYFAAAVHFFHSDPLSASPPLTIHGGLDFIPAVIARRLWGGQAYFLPTWAIYRLLALFASILLVSISYEFTKNMDSRAWLLGASALVAPQLVGYRDAFLLFSLYLFVILHDNNWHRSCKVSVSALFGVVAAFGLFWSFDRGIAGIVSLGIATLLLTRKQKEYYVAVVVFAVFVTVTGIFFPVFSFSNYINNVRILIETQSQWSYGWEWYPGLLTGFTLLLNVTAFSVYARSYYKSGLLESNIAEVLMFFLLSAFLLKIGTYRADVTHILFSLWVPMLMTLRTADSDPALGRYWKLAPAAVFLAMLSISMQTRTLSFALVAASLLYVACRTHKDFGCRVAKPVFYITLSVSLCFVIYRDVRGWVSGQYAWISLISTSPSNDESVAETIVWVAQQIKKNGAICVFDLSNNGLINGLTNRRSCSRFTYLVYAAGKHEDELIASIKRTMPSAIVYSSTYWSYAIDGRTMRDRFPALDSFILANYKREICSKEYCVRYISPTLAD